jgi:hypothetical protein
MKPTSFCQPGNGRKTTTPIANDSSVATSGIPRIDSRLKISGT